MREMQKKTETKSKKMDFRFGGSNKMSKEQRRCYDCGSAWVSYSPLEWRKVFCMVIEIDDKINADILKKAVKEMRDRLPRFFVNLKRTKFKDYYICTEDIDIVEEAPGNPIRTVPLFDEKKPLFRILYKENKLFIEFDHGLTDGNGMMMFFRSLITHYFELLGTQIGVYEYIHSIREQESGEEYIDNYIRCRVKEKIPMELLKDPENTVSNSLGEYQKYCYITVITFQTKDIVDKARKYFVSVTEYFATVILYAFYLEQQPQKGERMCINIPFDLRVVMGNQTLRNSSDTITIGLIPSSSQGASFLEFISSIRGQIKRRTEKGVLMQRIKRSVLITQNPFFKSLPQSLKLLAYIKHYYRLHGSSVTSFSNLGLVKYPKEVCGHIKSEYVAAVTNVRRGQVAFYCMSTEDKCVLTASHGSKDMDVINRLKKLLDSDDLEYEFTNMY